MHSSFYPIVAIVLFATICNSKNVSAQINRRSSRVHTDGTTAPTPAAIVVGENGMTQTRKFLATPSALETYILDLEVRERKALEARDMTTLQLLWDRDFTRENKNDKLVTQTSTLPYYVSVGRWIKDVFVAENIVTTKGTESGSFLEDGKTISFTREFLHTWMKKDDVWKLVGVSYE